MKAPKEKPLEQIHEVEIKDIKLSHDNVRLSHARKDLDELAASIARHGLLQPIVLIGTPDRPPYQLISGQRRFLAHKEILNRKKIRAVFTATALSKPQAIVQSLVENLQRVELEYADTAKAVTFLYQVFGKDEGRVQKETGLSLRKIRDFILIEARASTKMKNLIRARKVTPIDVKRALRAAQDDLGKAQELLDLIIEYKPSTTQKRRLVLYGESHTRASADSIFTEATKPRVEQNIVVSLSEDLRQGLANAIKSMRMEPEELAAKVLSDWLRNQGFVS